MGRDAVVGHKRLAIVDLSSAGDQPMVSANGRFVIVFNGEIYNYSELRRSLVADGVHLRSRCDTEVLLEAWVRYGEEMVHALRGMFAFAIWDVLRDILVLVRDHMGKKPLYVWESGGEIAFGSEIRALSSECTTSLNRDVIASYLTLGYVPEPQTVFREIRSIKPGTIAKWTKQGGLSEHVYWSPAGTEKTTVRRTQREVLIELDDKLRTSVERRLIGDVPVGVFLSGGVDSSLIASYVAENSPGALAVTVRFDVSSKDESAVAERTARTLGLEHEIVDVQIRDAAHLFDTTIEAMDQPFGDASAVPTLALCASARSLVKVALGGDGGDELFDGYSRYERFRRIWKFRWLSRLVPALKKQVFGLSTIRGAQRVWRMLESDDPFDAYIVLLEVWHHSPIESLGLPKAGFARMWLNDAWRARAGALSAPQELDLVTYLPNDILVKIDRASMWHGLEVRAPFLDVDLVEWVLRVTDSNSSWYRSKGLLKRLICDRVPGFDPHRKKQGFSLPVEEWLEGPLSTRLRKYCGRDYVRKQGLFDEEPIYETLIAFERGRKELHSPLWAYLVLQSWLERNGVV